MKIFRMFLMALFPGKKRRKIYLKHGQSAEEREGEGRVN
jgi:hypothetical protein